MKIYSPEEAERYIFAFGQFYASLNARQWYGDHVCMAAHPVTAHGSPDLVVDSMVPAAAAITKKWGEQILAALDDAEKVGQLREIIDSFESKIDETELADMLLDGMLEGLSLGALDSQWEREEEPSIELTTRPRQKASELFEEREVMDRATFDALSEKLKKQAFTFAGTAKMELLNSVHAELTKRIRTGTLDLRSFRKFAAERLETAGWTPKNASHVETIFRTNVASAMAAGRYAEQTQPAVIAALPYWQIVGIPDARQRKTHKQADKIILPADHPFWQFAYPPWGFACRCRVVARTRAWVKRTGAKIGPVPQNLPDPGFTAGPRGFATV